MKVITQSPELDNALVDPSNWADEQWVHDQFAWLRENAPLQQLSPEGFEPFWNVTRYNDIKEIEGNLKAHELIKIQVQVNDRLKRQEFLNLICKKLSAVPINHIGKQLVIFRANEDSKIKLP